MGRIEAMAGYGEVVSRYADDPATELRGQVAKALFNMGVLLGELGRSADAIAAYDEVVFRYGDDRAPHSCSGGLALPRLCEDFALTPPQTPNPAAHTR